MMRTPALPSRPTPQQAAAADPAVSAWVTASAGTGKTRVLADRVLRLLLEGTDPARILCITFTKAAAAEMVQRIQTDLADLAIEASVDRLDERLRRLAARAPDDAMRDRARRLFAQVLDLPGGMKIQTVHAFCQALLRRFPLEAGVPPHFELIEDRGAAELMREAREEVLAAKDVDLDPHLTLLAVNLDEQGLGATLADMVGKRGRVADLAAAAGGIEGLVARVWRVLEVEPGMSERDLAQAACADEAMDLPAFRRCAQALARGGKTDVAKAEMLADWIGATPEQRERIIKRYLGLFAKADGEPRGSFATKAVLAAMPELDDILAREQTRVLEFQRISRAVVIARRTEALLRVAWAMLEAYERRKASAAALDYEDLIARARALLRRPGIGAWVLYKLDGGLDHLLVDEGQDTSPAMWDLVAALTDEFFAGEGARDLRRTLFVVGDEKQSIYSFQGADLASFRASRARFRAQAEAAGLAWRDVTLDLSFRSTEAVLAAVDAVFADDRARPGVVEGEDVLCHRSARRDQPGAVELWPLVAATEREGDGDWSPPVERRIEQDLQATLAQRIAGTVAGWIANGERIEATGEPIRAGDVLVLLPRRGAIQAELVRAFKEAGVPVAGADRMALSDQLAVMDLVALGEAVLLPEDDLNLAAVLKGPLFALSEDDLFTLAHGRGRARLFDRWRQAARSRPDLAEMLARFEGLRRAADFAPPFEFYARLLGQGGARRRLLTRLGPDAEDAIEEFLAQALAYEQGHAPSLQGFLHWLGMGEGEVRRDPARPRDEVRIMTVHGAKGLEAPIVFLPDTHYVPQPQDRLLWREEDGLPLWRMAREGRDPVSEAADRVRHARQLEEHRRLLYVALTRARDRLVVCGWKPGKKPTETPWYELVRDALAGRPDVEQVTLPGIEGEGLRLRIGDEAGSVNETARGDETVAASPAWLGRPVPEEPVLPRPTSPSRGEDDPLPTTGPFVEDGRRFRRGRLVHELLQILPDLPADGREGKARLLLARAAPDLDAAERGEILRQVSAVLDHPDLAAAFGPGGRAEQPIVGVIDGHAIAGQIDRLAVTSEAVLVVDYKTNRRPPDSPERVPAAYLRQMATYRALLARVWPAHEIRCLLVWTETAAVTALPGDLLDHHMTLRGSGREHRGRA